MAWAACGLAMLAGGAPARADLAAADSAHFVLYGNADPAMLAQLASRLERFHAALEQATGLTPPQGAGAARLTVYVARSRGEMRRLAGQANQAGNLQGFYLARSDGPVAVVSPSALQRGDGYRLALHEYVHHFMAMAGRADLPRWVSEGAAEFYAASDFAANGTVLLGGANPLRQRELRRMRGLSAADLLAGGAGGGALAANSAHNAFYGKSWQLYRLLARAPDRAGQLDRYLGALGEGQDAGAAAVLAFGDPLLLERELGNVEPGSWAVNAATAPAAPKVGKLSRGGARVLPWLLQARTGLGGNDAMQLARARTYAARHGQDAGVVAGLAALEAQAGNHAAALQQAERALTLDPANAPALAVRAQALLRHAADGSDADKAAAGAGIAAWLAAEPDSPAALAARYRWQALGGGLPDAAATAGLERAVTLAPYDPVLRLDLAELQARQGRVDAARLTLAPLAQAPGGGAPSQLARARLAELPVEPGATRAAQHWVLAALGATRRVR